jgi:nicotinamidase-related amidase
VSLALLEKPALILIDVQREYFTRESPLWIPDGERVLERLAGLLATARSSEVGIVHVQHHEAADSPVFATGTSNVETMADVAPKEGEALIQKHLPGSFDGTDLDNVLGGMGTRSLVIGGFMTHMCCDTTAREAHARGLEVVFLTDGTATRDLPAPSGETIPHSIVHETTLAAQADGFSTLMDVGAVRAYLERHPA